MGDKNATPKKLVNHVHRVDGPPRDANGHTDAEVVRQAMAALDQMCPATRDLMAYIEILIRTKLKSELDDAPNARFVASTGGSCLNPNMHLVTTRDISPTKYQGARTVGRAELPLARKFITGVCRDHFRERGVMVIVEEAPYVSYLDMPAMGCCFAEISIVNTSIVLKQVVEVVTNAPQTIGELDKLLPRVTAVPLRPLAASIQPTHITEARRRTTDRIMGIEGVGYEPPKPANSAPSTPMVVGGGISFADERASNKIPVPPTPPASSSSSSSNDNNV